MTNADFEQLVQRLEAQSRQSPAFYQFKVLLLALLGNAYLGAVVALILALIGVLLASVAVLKALAIKLIVAMGFFLWMILKAVWIKIEPPTGTEITRAQAPELFAMIDQLRKALGSPGFHHVLITDEFNAGVVQSPRLGIFGWPRNYLLIGLPLMQGLTEAQFKAVLAHEFGHLARGHGRLSNWIYCQRLRWARLLGILEATESRGSFLFKPFIRWFSPYFNAYSFPLARANEYEADATSARLTSPGAAAQALTAVNVVASFLAERYWRDIHQQADELPHPAFSPYAGMGRSLGGELDEVSAKTWLEQSLARQTSLADTHPSLTDRLGALQAQPELALPKPEEGADRLLGDQRETITARFDQRWRENIAAAWAERYRTVQEEKERLTALNARRDNGETLSVTDAFERAMLTESAGKNPEEAFEQLQALHVAAPDHMLVCLALGARRLERDDASGCGLIEHAMQLDENAIARGCELLRDFHWRNDRREEAEAWHQRLVERQSVLAAAEKERNQVLLTEKFDRHDLSEDARAKLRQQLQAIPGLRKAYLVKKRVRHLAHRPCYVLGYRAVGFFRFQRKRHEPAVLQQLRTLPDLPGETLILSVDGDNYQFGRKFAWMRGTRIL